ncbi:MAG: flavodoxin [Deltaproteobacteria bacterium RIFOXYD12_FULL_57_12]|nr:MAG: flavodoxin [Deltaproteobacteria bacterium RIFOXYD12_FULL_57_12]
MTDVLAFLGSPRKGGNSEELLMAMLRGVEAAGGLAELIRLCDLRIEPCLSCGGCDHTGKCVIEDDMGLLYEKIIKTDRIILASPIFFYGVTAQAKAFIDRTQALWNRKKLLKEKGEWQNQPGRNGFFISVAATHGSRVFEGAVLTMKYAFDAMDMHYAGDLLVRGIDKRGEMKRADRDLAAAEEAGKNFFLNRKSHVD